VNEADIIVHKENQVDSAIAEQHDDNE